MSDFLIHFGNDYRGGDLLARLQSLYGHPAPKGYSFDFGWGSLAVLQERFPPANVHRKGGVMLAWLGDPLFHSADHALKELGALAASVRSVNRNGSGSLDLEGQAGGLNGSFVLLFADAGGAGVVTDFIGSIPAYLCHRTDGQPSRCHGAPGEQPSFRRHCFRRGVPLFRPYRLSAHHARAHGAARARQHPFLPGPWPAPRA
jgi:hypothetical protein